MLCQAERHQILQITECLIQVDCGANINDNLRNRQNLFLVTNLKLKSSSFKVHLSGQIH